MSAIHRFAAATFLVLASLGSLATSAAAADRVNASAGLTEAGAPLAIHGYDPVAFFTQGKALVGKMGITAIYQDAAFRFVSEANKKVFEANPERYAPQYGGYCAFGAAKGAKYDGDPRVFAIVGGKLYFNLSPDIQKKWNEDVAGYIKKADASWPKIADRAPGELK
jgi:hypothetical protein